MAESSVPVRTCVGCRARVPVTELMRVVARDGTLVPDLRRRLPGRGASLHPTPECLHAAVRRRAFPRALRCSAPLEAGPLQEHILGAPERAAGDGREQRASSSPDGPTAPPPVGPAPGRTAPEEQDLVG